MTDGVFTNDGCSVEVYRRLPAAGEPEIVHAAVPGGAVVLDLGSGSGRIAHALLDLGHPVVAVDDSAEMLAHVRGAETIRSRIEDLRLDHRFDAVLLASHLVNTEDEAARQAMLATAAHHLADGGKLLVEWHPPAWFATVADGQGGRLGDVDLTLENVTRDADLLSATVRYSAGADWWLHPFTCRRLTEPVLHEALSATGLAFAGWLTPSHDWFAAQVQSTHTVGSSRPPALARCRQRE
jgi:SAM-dependent methyltransferase